MADNKKHIVILVICTDIFYRLIKCISKSNLDFRTATFNYENIESELAHKAFNSEIIYLKVTARGQDYNFYYGPAPDAMELLAENIDGKILSSDLAEGFVGTPYLCKVLSKNGCNDLAYTLLLNKDCSSWLYSVIMGATTIWERWNSIIPDGKINSEGMNSLNHYVYGSIVEWMYRYMAGINPVEDKPGFRHIKLTPMPDYRFKYVKSNYNSTVGVYESQWEITEEGNLNFKFVIPFNATASLILPDAKLENVKVNNKLLKDTELKSSQSNKNISVELTSGSYEFNYLLEVAYIKYYGIDVSLGELATNKDVKRIVGEKLPMMMAEDMLERSGHESLRELSFAPFSPVTNEILEELDMKLGKIKTSVI